MYADLPRTSFEPTLAYYRFKHRENRDDRHLGRFLTTTPVYAMWDDHEGAGTTSTAPTRTSRRAARPSASTGRWPVPDVLYRRFAWGSGADFFALDCRQYRSPQSDPEGPAKTMLGARQKAWLKDGLRASRAPAKFLLSSVPLQGPWGADRWAGYATERDELLRFIRDERIRGVIVLSGDVHTAVDIEPRRRSAGVRRRPAGRLAVRAGIAPASGRC